MAASYTWPPTLPQVPNRGFTESIGLNVLRTPMDSGPAKTRVRSNKPMPMTISFMLKTSEVAILEDFVLNTVKGMYRFYFPHPRKLTTVEVRILPQQEGVFFTSTYKAPGYWDVSLQIEILP